MNISHRAWLHMHVLMIRKRVEHCFHQFMIIKTGRFVAKLLEGQAMLQYLIPIRCNRE